MLKSTRHQQRTSGTRKGAIGETPTSVSLSLYLQYMAALEPFLSITLRSTTSQDTTHNTFHLTISTSTMSAPFRLLHLPTEIRLMIFERISTTPRRCEYRFDTHKTSHPSTISLNITSLPTSLLATSKLISHEVTPILAPRLAELRIQPLDLALDTTSLQSVFDRFYPLGQRLESYLAPNTIRDNDIMEHSKTCVRKSCRIFHRDIFYHALATLIAQRSPSSIILSIRRSPLHSMRLAITDLVAAINSDQQ
jgi:hypothetical protein